VPTLLLVEDNLLKKNNLVAEQNNFKVIMKDGKIYKNML